MTTTPNNDSPNKEILTGRELLSFYKGITERMQTIFSYHYDQIQREIKVEISKLPELQQDSILDSVATFMEEVMNWPHMPQEDPDMEEFIKDIAGE